MADSKISALAALTGANVEQLADVLAIVDTSVTTSKKILISELSQALLVIGTSQATTSGTEFDFTIPAWAKRVTVMLSGVSTNGTSPYLIQLGDGGGIETSGYVSAAGTRSSDNAETTGFVLHTAAVAARAYYGQFTLNLEKASAFTWVGSGTLIADTTPTPVFSAGGKSLSAALTTVRLTTTNGTDAFDAGEVNVLYD